MCYFRVHVANWEHDDVEYDPTLVVHLVLRVGMSINRLGVVREMRAGTMLSRVFEGHCDLVIAQIDRLGLQPWCQDLCF